MAYPARMARGRDTIVQEDTPGVSLADADWQIIIFYQITTRYRCDHVPLVFVDMGVSYGFDIMIIQPRCRLLLLPS
jgi:hypothetical protein